ncbi:Mitochondrial carrier family protein [Clavispora lusitaniae]|uniref:Mitochondrial carrier family protein n=1 Tax=Clavispora lusitaniae TaxID=36911 RepID=UPI0016B5B5A9|nr:hypothetical protein E0198_002237 [Clavispora lusitaniae]KAF7579750.1 Mitochondrial carrier family protein [Clavispora lusitaniae]
MDPAREVAYGAAAGCLGKLVEFPFDTVKVRLQASVSSHATLATIVNIYRHEGISGGFYKGVRAPLVGACAESAVLFCGFSWAQKMLAAHTSLERDSVLSAAAAGSFAGFAAAFVLTPVELVKCRLQVANVQPQNTQNAQNAHVAPTPSSAHLQPHLQPNSASVTSAARGAKPASYGSVLLSVVRRHGVRGLWHGLGSTLAREMVGTAVWFASFEAAARALRQLRPQAEKTNLLISGATAGVAFHLVVYPVDTIKSNIQTHEGERLSTRAAAAQILARPGGASNLYRGLGITLCRSIPANAAIFFTYEWLKQNY